MFCECGRIRPLALSALLFSFPLPSLYFSPLRYRPHGIGNWSGHIPFACDLIASLRPSVFVELGTHLGESYFAFCQAIAEGRTQCKAYAVDIWQGDLHTGAYGDEVFDEVAAYNRYRYSEFSQLLRMFFDEAIGRFEPESIDLLHIDGLHTYEAVRRDFDTWWPRVRPGGIVLLHDTFERNADFGVWKLLSELSENFPTREFDHSNGLGVVLKRGGRPVEGLLSALFAEERNCFDGAKRYYEICANHLEHRFWSERRKQPANWDITTQLFWRSEGEDFSELKSVRSSRTITAERSQLRLAVPPASSPPIELRLDLADCPAFFEVNAIRVRGASEEVAWSLAISDENASDLRSCGLKVVATGEGTGLLVLDAPASASFLLPAPESIVRSLQAGGELILETTGLTPQGFVAKLSSSLERQLIRQHTSLSQAFNHAESLAIERLQQLGQYDSALTEAQRIVSTQHEEFKLELNSIADKLKQSEDLVSALRSRESSLAGELDQVRATLVERELELVDLNHRLGEIESSFAWRAVRSLTRLRARTKP